MARGKPVLHHNDKTHAERQAFAGEITKAFPELEEGDTPIRWRSPDGEIHSGMIHKHPQHGEVVVDAGVGPGSSTPKWHVYKLSSIDIVNDENRTEKEQAAWDADAPKRTEALKAAEVSKDQRIADLEARLKASEERQAAILNQFDARLAAIEPKKEG